MSCLESEQRVLGSMCPNCGSASTAAFCAACGQRQGEGVPTVGQWTSEVLDELFLVNGKLPVTLKLLLRRPGHLTSEWVEGRRSRYLHPFRLYLLTAATYFLMAPWLQEGGGVLVNMVEGASESFGPDVQDAASSFVVAWWQPVLMVIMLPVVALALRFVIERDRRFVEHLVFSLHFHSALFVLLLAVLPFSRLPNDSFLTWLQGAPYLVGLVGLVLAFRHHYQRSRARAILGAGAVAVSYLAAFFIVFGVLLGVGIRAAGAS